MNQTITKQVQTIPNSKNMGRGERRRGAGGSGGLSKDNYVFNSHAPPVARARNNLVLFFSVAAPPIFSRIFIGFGRPGHQQMMNAI